VLAEIPRLGCAARRGRKGLLNTPNSGLCRNDNVRPLTLALSRIGERELQHNAWSELKWRLTGFSFPSVALSSAVEPGAFGNQLFEFRDSLRFVQAVRASFDCRPARRAAQGSAQHRGGWRSFSLGSFFLDKQKKEPRLSGRDPTCVHSAKFRNTTKCPLTLALSRERRGNHASATNGSTA